MAHSFHYVLIHVVFSTKERRPTLTEDIRARLFTYMGGIVREAGGKALIINGVVDHVHCLVSMPSTVSSAEMIRMMKGKSSKWVHEHFPEKRSFAWQRGYETFSLSHSKLGEVTRYITNQEEHHRKVSFQEEFLSLLKKHDIEFDERYIWG